MVHKTIKKQITIISIVIVLNSYFNVFSNNVYGYEFLNSSSSASNEDTEAKTQRGGTGYMVRSIWAGVVASFENFMSDDDKNITVMYDIKSTYNSQATINTSPVGYAQYYQDDYADVKYGDSTIKRSGCGPTCFAMVATQISGRTITPVDAISWCGSKYLGKGGTSWDYFGAAKNYFKLNCRMEITESGEKVIEALKSGALVISSQSKGTFTTKGHFIVLYAIDNDGKISVKDPLKTHAVGKNYNSKKFDFYSDIDNTAKKYWIFYY